MAEPAGAPRQDVADRTVALVGHLRAGEPEGGELLDRLYRGPISRFCWGYLGSVEDAQDAAQDVFCKVLRARHIPDHFRSWLYKIARNHCLNLLRSRARGHGEQTLPSDSKLEAALTGHATRLVKQELRSRLGHLVAALPLAYREVLRLRYVEGLSRAEIADVLELPVSVVKSRLYEGITKLREHTSLLDDR